MCFNMRAPPPTHSPTPALSANVVQGGNDNEIFESPLTIGHTVTCPEDTIQQCKELFFKE